MAIIGGAICPAVIGLVSDATNIQRPSPYHLSVILQLCILALIKNRPAGAIGAVAGYRDRVEVGGGVCIIDAVFQVNEEILFNIIMPRGEVGTR
jgi:hypothetical protein